VFLSVNVNSGPLRIVLQVSVNGWQYIFGVYLPADGLIDNYRQELNALDDLYSYYINFGNVIVAGNLNVSCINKNLEFSNTMKSK
jgi:hypothetical protein